MDASFFQRALLSGIYLSLVTGAIIVGSLAYNARLWLQDYPKPIRDKVPPLSPEEKRGRAIVGVLFIGALLGGLILETLRLRSGPDISFGAAYLNFFIVLSVFNLFDALVIDFFLITLLKPRFVILPGMEGMEYLFHDYRKHLTDFLKGMVFVTVGSLPFALAASL